MKRLLRESTNNLEKQDHDLAFVTCLNIQHVRAATKDYFHYRDCVSANCELFDLQNVRKYWQIPISNPQMTSSNILFGLTSCPKPKDIEFAIEDGT